MRMLFLSARHTRSRTLSHHIVGRLSLVSCHCDIVGATIVVVIHADAVCSIQCLCHCSLSCAINTRSHRIMTKVFVHKNRNQMNNTRTSMGGTRARSLTVFVFAFDMFLFLCSSCVCRFVCHWPILITVSFISFTQQTALCINNRLTHVHFLFILVVAACRS